MTTIRWATPDDAHGVAIVHVDAWRTAYAGLIDQQVLDAQSVEHRTAMWRNWIERSLAGESTDAYGPVPHRLLVAQIEGRIIGWAGFGGGRDADSTHQGELAGLYAYPSTWSQGIGHALISRAEDELRAEGWTEAYLWVLKGNDRAIRFYERHGWIADGREKRGEGGSVQGLHEIRHSRRLSYPARPALR
ncbi:GNAT family N-acetyltransferase [Microbacterium sp. SD291]|uniref:GNAT family N-acetyltransferase n=1 Tax=Microbacterium sp. SD291 TaxID=2782007 RepID=UPI001A97B24C|nr:GNAT family N-acetyltransferase [Microbacterium sp. SD291]MBO0981478.1 GNAT family N-acetyltransferase [Microbacterium sp. SD291]